MTRATPISALAKAARASNVKMPGCTCPNCGGNTSSVVDSRAAVSKIDGTTSTRRRRVCLTCDNRFTTHEIVVSDIDQFMVEAREKMVKRIINSLMQEFMQ